jgi:DNA-directed RNA polymerase specialized sigma24 family protein
MSSRSTDPPFGQQSLSSTAESLLRQCAQGDRAALRAIYDAEASRMLGVALRLLRRRALAEEAVHDSFLQVWQKAASFDPKRGETEALKRCLDRLEPNRRKAILLAYVHGLSHGEIAGRLGVPLGTMKSWIRRSLLVLRECLG